MSGVFYSNSSLGNGSARHNFLWVKDISKIPLFQASHFKDFDQWTTIDHDDYKVQSILMIDGIPSCTSGGALWICRFALGPSCLAQKSGQLGWVCIESLMELLVQVSVNGSDWVDGKVAYEVNFFIVILIDSIIFILMMNSFGSFCGCPTYLVLKRSQ